MEKLKTVFALFAVLADGSAVAAGHEPFSRRVLVAGESQAGMVALSGNLGNPAAGAQAAMTLGQMGAVALPLLVTALGHDRPTTRQHAAHGLEWLLLGGQTGVSAAASQALSAAIDDPVPQVRRAVLDALAVNWPLPAAEPALAAALQRDDAPLRRTVAGLLGGLPRLSRSSLATLARLAEKGGETGAAAAAALGGRRGMSIVALGHLARHDDVGVRQAVAMALGRTEHSETLPLLGRLMADQSGGVRLLAALSYAERQPGRVSPAALKVLAVSLAPAIEPPWSMAMRARHQQRALKILDAQHAQGLPLIGHLVQALHATEVVLWPEALARAREEGCDGEPWLTAAAVLGGVGQLFPDEVAAQLSSLAQGDRWQTRHEVVVAYAVMTQRHALYSEEIGRALNDPEPMVRARAATELRWSAAGGPELRREFALLLESEDNEYVRFVLRAALRG